MKKEFSPIILLLSAILITIIIVPFGILYNLIKSLIECFKGKFIKGITKFLIYWLKIIYQIWCVIKFALIKVAVILDLIWNATSGEMIEDAVTTEENTLYGKGEVTVSAATGEIEFERKFTKFGIIFNKVLSFCLGKNHSIDAYEKYLLDIKQSSNK